MREALARRARAGRRGQPDRRRPGAEGPDRRVHGVRRRCRCSAAGVAAFYGELLDGIVADEERRRPAGAADRHAHGRRARGRAARARAAQTLALRARRSAYARQHRLPAMRTAAVLPVKRFARAKQRLGESVADPLRAELARAMVADVLLALVATRRDRAHDRRHGASRGRARGRASRGAIVVEDAHESGQSAAAALGIARALAEGAERVLCVPGDCPALDPAELERLLAEPPATAPRVVIVPDRHGTGTNGAAADAARRDRAGLRPRQLRASPRRSRAAAGAPAARRARARCCSTSTPAPTWRRCASASRDGGRAARTRARSACRRRRGPAATAAT